LQQSPPPPHSNCIEFPGFHDPFKHQTNLGPGSRVHPGKLTKMNFPKFDGENPQLWKFRCERYFEMYEVDETVWVKVASMHFEGPAA
jgi:hypothetical protein